MNIENEKCNFDCKLPRARSLHTHPADGSPDRYEQQTNMESLTKRFICIFGLLLTFTYCRGQNSPGLDALFLNAEIIVEGTIQDKRCRPPMNINSAVKNHCVVTLYVTEIIKGNPKLSNRKINQISVNGETKSLATIDTISEMHFEHLRMNITNPSNIIQNQDSIFHLDYNIKIGDSVIVFLKEGSDDCIRSKLNIPKEWFIYYLVDDYLGVITANDYVTEYLIKQSRNK